MKSLHERYPTMESYANEYVRLYASARVALGFLSLPIDASRDEVQGRDLYHETNLTPVEVLKRLFRNHALMSLSGQQKENFLRKLAMWVEAMENA